MTTPPILKRLTGHEIFERLNNGTYYWGSNDQPSIYLVTAILEALPVTWVAGGADTLQITLERNLTELEHWSIDRLMPDQINRDGNEINLWWD